MCVCVYPCWSVYVHCGACERRAYGTVYAHTNVCIWNHWRHVQPNAVAADDIVQAHHTRAQRYHHLYKLDRVDGPRPTDTHTDTHTHTNTQIYTPRVVPHRTLRKSNAMPHTAPTAATHTHAHTYIHTHAHTCTCTQYQHMYINTHGAAATRRARPHDVVSVLPHRRLPPPRPRRPSRVVQRRRHAVVVAPLPSRNTTGPTHTCTNNRPTRKPVVRV